MSRKHKKFCVTLNYIEHFLILASEIPLEGSPSFRGINKLGQDIK